MDAQNKDVNISVIQSVWHRTKKEYVELRDLPLEKEVKGGGGMGNSKPITGGTGHHRQRLTRLNRPPSLLARNRRFQFHKSSQYFIRSRNETLSVAMCVGNPDVRP
jgi:hypothetical protein